MTEKIAIYRGEGAWYQGVVPGKSLTAQQIVEGGWEQATSLFIMPGGRDRLFHSVLQGPGNRKIRSFVENGGTYLGICAGAYYGCAEIEFDKGTSLEICERRELCFFSGIAIGPAYGKGTFEYDSPKTIRAAHLSTRQGKFHVYHNGGCYFADDLSSCRILARYCDIQGNPPAIIECKVGKGKAILSGVHLEINADALDLNEPRLSACIPLLRASEARRIRFWEKFILTL